MVLCEGLVKFCDSATVKRTNKLANLFIGMEAHNSVSEAKLDLGKALIKLMLFF